MHRAGRAPLVRRAAAAVRRWLAAVVDDVLAVIEGRPDTLPPSDPEEWYPVTPQAEGVGRPLYLPELAHLDVEPVVFEALAGPGPVMPLPSPLAEDHAWCCAPDPDDDAGDASPETARVLDDIVDGYRDGIGRMLAESSCVACKMHPRFPGCPDAFCFGCCDCAEDPQDVLADEDQADAYVGDVTTMTDAQLDAVLTDADRGLLDAIRVALSADSAYWDRLGTPLRWGDGHWGEDSLLVQPFTPGDVAAYEHAQMAGAR
jgi:hypothetical protein